MPSIKKSVMLSEKMQNYIAARQRLENEDDDYAWSRGVNAPCSALIWITNQVLPDLTEYEWQCVLNVYNGHHFDDNIHNWTGIAGCMMDDVGAISIEELEPNYAEVVKKMHKLSAIEQYAVMDMTRKFWANPHTDKGKNSLLEIIESLKGK